MEKKEEEIDDLVCVSMEYKCVYCMCVCVIFVFLLFKIRWMSLSLEKKIAGSFSSLLSGRIYVWVYTHVCVCVHITASRSFMLNHVEGCSPVSRSYLLRRQTKTSPDGDSYAFSALTTLAF